MGRAGSMRRVALALAFLLALCWQNFVTATHIHPETRASLSASRTATGQQLSRPAGPSRDPAICPICRQAALAGHYLSPAPLVFAGAAAILVYLFAPLFVRWNRRRRSHAWHSRGPPSLRRA